MLLRQGARAGEPAKAVCLQDCEGDDEPVRAARAALRTRILAAAHDEGLMQGCPEVAALARRVAGAWSPTGLDLCGDEPEDEGGWGVGTSSEG